MPLRILIVRTSSLGDLVHILPAISDIGQHFPHCTVDWVVEEAFAEIPAWHPAVTQVIKVAHRRWRQAWWSTQVRRERRALYKRLRAEPYDIILDMQALLKSAWLVRQARGVRHGLDWLSAREPLASCFYHIKHKVAFWQPAVTRQRVLAGLALGYTPTGQPNFGLQHLCREAIQAKLEGSVEGGRNLEGKQSFKHGESSLISSGDYAVIMPSASRADKLWPVADWQAVLHRLSEVGCRLCLLAGNKHEAERAGGLITGLAGAEVLPRMNLTAIARCLAGARIMVGLDSGLTHLSAALGRPTIGIYSASTPVRTPLTGDAYTASLGDREAPPPREVVLAAIEQALLYG